MRLTIDQTFKAARGEGLPKQPAHGGIAHLRAVEAATIAARKNATGYRYELLHRLSLDLADAYSRAKGARLKAIEAAEAALKQEPEA